MQDASIIPRHQRQNPGQTRPAIGSPVNTDYWIQKSSQRIAHGYVQLLYLLASSLFRARSVHIRLCKAALVIENYSISWAVFSFISGQLFEKPRSKIPLESNIACVTGVQKYARAFKYLYVGWISRLLQLFCLFVKR